MTPTPCPGCNRIVAYRFARQKVAGGGKARTYHKCSHGVPCVFGSKHGTQGWNGPAIAGQYHCPECVAAWKARRDIKLNTN